MLLKPVKVPPWLEQALSVLPYIYLGAGVLFAATGSAFIICQYDPFVPIFRMSGRTLMVLSGAALLLLGVFVGRPYCRFLCPYGALLKLGAIVAKWRVRVTPDYCTQCRLCEASCPFGAMREPEVQPSRRASLDQRPPAPGLAAGAPAGAPGRRRLAGLAIRRARVAAPSDGQPGRPVGARAREPLPSSARCPRTTWRSNARARRRRRS